MPNEENNYSFFQDRISVCKVLYTAAFSDCRRNISVKSYYQECLDDLCQCSIAKFVDCHCSVVGKFARDCARAGFDVGKWRMATSCGKLCVVRKVGLLSLVNTKIYFFIFMQNAHALAIKYTWSVLQTARPRAKTLCPVCALKNALVVVSVQKVGSVMLVRKNSCAPSEYSWPESALPVVDGLLLCNAQWAGEITQTQVALPIPGAALRVKRLFFAALSGDKCGIVPSFRGFPHVMDCTPLQKAVPRKPYTLKKLFLQSIVLRDRWNVRKEQLSIVLSF